MKQIEDDGGWPVLRKIYGCKRLFRFVPFLDVQSKEGKTSQEWRVTADGYEISFGGDETVLGINGDGCTMGEYTGNH